MATKAHSGEKLIASNKKAFHDYFVLEKHEAGLALTGTEAFPTGISVLPDEPSAIDASAWRV